MRRSCLLVLALGVVFGMVEWCVAQEDDLAKSFPIVSKFDAALADTQNNLNDLIYYRYGWNNQRPYTIALQFVNFGYRDHKLKFAVKDVTSKKMVLLDAVHHSNFGTETLKASSTGMIWSGPINNVNDRFSLRVWVDDGDEMDKEPMSIKDKK